MLLGKDKIGKKPWQVMTMAQYKFPKKPDGSIQQSFTLDIRTDNPMIPMPVRDLTVVGNDVIFSVPAYESEKKTIPHNFRVYRAGDKVPIYLKGQEYYPYIGSVIFKGELLYVFEYFFKSSIQTPGGGNIIPAGGQGN